MLLDIIVCIKSGLGRILLQHLGSGDVYHTAHGHSTRSVPLNSGINAGVAYPFPQSVVAWATQRSRKDCRLHVTIREVRLSSSRTSRGVFKEWMFDGNRDSKEGMRRSWTRLLKV